MVDDSVTTMVVNKAMMVHKMKGGRRLAVVDGRPVTRYALLKAIESEMERTADATIRGVLEAWAKEIESHPEGVFVDPRSCDGATSVEEILAACGEA